MIKLLAVISLTAIGASCSQNSIKKNFIVSAQSYYAKGAWEDSYALAKLATKSDQNNEDAYLLQVQNLSKMGELTNAHGILHERLALRPHSTKINLALVNWHIEFGAKEAALAVAKRMILRDNSNLEVHKIIAELSLENKKWDEAEASLVKIFEQDKFDEASALSLGKLYLMKNHFEKALVVFNQLVLGKNQKIEAAKYLAWMHAENGKINESNKYIRQLSVEKQNDPFVQKIVTRNLLNSSDVDKITVLNNYLSKNKDDWGVHQLYLALKEAGYKEKALDLLADVWNEAPQKKWAAINYANYFYEVGETKTAQEILKKAAHDSDEQDLKLISSIRQRWEENGNYVVPARKIANVLRVHTVKKGETLGGIAHKYLLDASRWNEIFEKNKLKIHNPSLLVEGAELVIPEIQQ
jgi:thioredoxin-like negative regulator of GroEL